LVGKADFQPLEALLVAAGTYWVLTAIFTFFQSRLERRIGKGYVRGGQAGGRRTKVVSVSGQGNEGGDLPMVEEDVAGPELGGQGH
jgi:polar amino acid transport system permease protein